MPSAAVLELVTAVAVRDGREEAAGTLAAHLGAQHLLLFVRDHEVQAYLPAPGFPRTLPDGRRWRAFLEAASVADSTEAQLPFGAEGREFAAQALAARDVVLVLLGGAPAAAVLEEVATLMPLLSEAMRAEQAAVAAIARADGARAAAAEASGLALALDQARRDLRVLYHELREALAAREMFFAMASHEMKTPLAVIKGYAQLLIRQLRGLEPDAVPLAEMAVTIEHEVDRMGALVADLLELGAYEGNKQGLHRESMDLVAVARQVLNRFEHDPRRSSRTVFTFDAPPVLLGEWDRERVDQVLTNLLSNAVKYSPEGGEVNLALTQDGPRAVIRLSDHGQGIRAEDLPKIFSPFYRSQDSSNVEGTGLGLYITSQLVEQHGGQISVMSELGRGSVFTVVLPLTQ